MSLNKRSLISRFTFLSIKFFIKYAVERGIKQLVKVTPESPQYLSTNFCCEAGIEVL